MKENELRLNNLVIVNYKTDLLSKVTWIKEGSINVIFDRQPDLVDSVICSVNDLIPIPFTEEWILKSGKSHLFRFQTCWRGRFAYLKINGCRFMWFSDTNTIEIDGGEYVLHFLHEFQNLFFSLTGEELVFSTEP